jgi:glutamate:GABA antiporter
MDTSIREVTTQATLEEKKKLKKEFKLFDMIFVTIAAIIGIDTLGAVSSNGAQALTWLLISAVTFLIPYGLLTSELGSTFTQEGGVYEWVKLAFGRIPASFAAMLYWISNPLWVGGTLSVTAIVAIKVFWFQDANYVFFGSQTGNALTEIVIALLFIWGVTWSAILSLRVGKWLSVFGSYAKFTLFALFVVLAIVYFTGGHSSGAHIALRDIVPTGNLAFIFSAILPVLIFNWAGFELQNGAGEEMENPQRDVPRSLIRAGIIAVIGYAIPITVILFTLSKSQLSNAGGFLKSYQIVASVLPTQFATILGWIVALGIVVALASSGGTWIIGADRTYAIASLDRTAPVMLGRFSGRYGTPIAVNAMSGITASVAMIAAVIINTFFSTGSIAGLFGLVLGFVISTTTLSYLFIFPSYLALRIKYPNVHRPFVVPGGLVGAVIATVLTFVYAAVASIFLLWPTDLAIANSGFDRTTYELAQFIPLAVIAVLTLVFYVWGHAEKRNADVIVDYNLETRVESVGGGE